MWRVGLGTSVSSDHISPRSSAISTNSKARTRFTTFGSKEDVGLYGLTSRKAASKDVVLSGGANSPKVAAARRSRSAADPADRLNVGRGGSWVGSGSSPSLVPWGWGEGPQYQWPRVFKNFILVHSTGINISI